MDKYSKDHSDTHHILVWCVVYAAAMSVLTVHSNCSVSELLSACNRVQQVRPSSCIREIKCYICAISDVYCRLSCVVVVFLFALLIAKKLEKLDGAQLVSISFPHNTSALICRNSLHALFFP